MKSVVPKRFVYNITDRSAKHLYYDQGYSVLHFELPEENKISRERMCLIKEFENQPNVSGGLWHPSSASYTYSFSKKLSEDT